MPSLAKVCDCWQRVFRILAPVDVPTASITSHHRSLGGACFGWAGQVNNRPEAGRSAARLQRVLDLIQATEKTGLQAIDGAL